MRGRRRKISLEEMGMRAARRQSRDDLFTAAWVIPGEQLTDVERRLQRLIATPGDLRLAAKVVDAYTRLVAANARERERVVHGIRRRRQQEVGKRIALDVLSAETRLMTQGRPESLMGPSNECRHRR
jgi:hypothetical protein